MCRGDGPQKSATSRSTPNEGSILHSSSSGNGVRLRTNLGSRRGTWFRGAHGSGREGRCERRDRASAPSCNDIVAESEPGPFFFFGRYPAIVDESEISRRPQLVANCRFSRKRCCRRSSLGGET